MTSPESTSYLAFDLGASTSRAILGTLNGNVLEMVELHRFATPVLEEDDQLFWDLDVMWTELQVGLEKALAASSDLRSLSVDSWAVDYVTLNATGEPVRNPYCYRDPRTQGVMERSFETVSAEDIYTVTGIQFLPFNTLYQMMVERDKEANLFATTHLTIADFLNYQFSGVKAIEVSMASTTQMMDVHSRQWSTSLLERFGMAASEWPDIVKSGSRLGPALQAPEVEVIATCSHDTGSAVAATPAASGEENWAFISCGTWSCMGAERIDPLLTDAARTAGFTNEAGLDETIRYLKNLTGLWALQECMREWRRSGPLEWSDLQAEAQEARARFQGLQPPTINLEDSRFLARGPMASRIKDYCREYNLGVPDNRGEIVLAVLSSIAESYARTLIELESTTGIVYKRIHLFGGGSQNTLLCQLTANALDREIVAGPAEATAMGNLLIQARTMGDFSPGTRIRDIVRHSSDLGVYFPDSERN